MAEREFVEDDYALTFCYSMRPSILKIVSPLSSFG